MKPFANDVASPHERLNKPLKGNVRIALLPEGFAEGIAKGILERFAEGVYKYNTHK